MEPEKLAEISKIISEISQYSNLTLDDIKLFLNNQLDVIKFDWFSNENKELTGHDNLIKEGYVIQTPLTRQQRVERNQTDQIFHYVHDMSKYKSIVYYHPIKLEVITF